VAGVPLAIFFGVVTGIATMIPVVGAGLILIAVLLAFITIYRETYLSETNKQADNQSQLPATD
jgi:predicted PurR-regulated permease PerM